MKNNRFIESRFTNPLIFRGDKTYIGNFNVIVTNRMLSFNPIGPSWEAYVPGYNNIHDIGGKDGLSTVVTSSALVEKPYGALKYNSGDLAPEGWALWFFDADGQPSGYTFTIDDGMYRADVFGDDPATPAKEGIPLGAQVSAVFAQGPDGLFYHSAFDQPVVMSGEGTLLQRDITIGDLALADILWTGAINATWGVGQVANWLLDGGPRVYWDGDHAIIGDAAGPQALTLVGAVYPGSVLVSNTTADVVLGGTGSIAGPCGLTKSGGGILTIRTANSYTGETRINAGALVVAADGALGASAVRLGDTAGSSDAALLVSGAFTVDRPISVEDDGSPTSLRTLGGTNTAGVAVFCGDITLLTDLTLTAAPGGTVRFDGALDDSEGHTITKVGAGTVIFDGLQTYGPGALLEILDGTVFLNTDAGSPGAADLSIWVADAELYFGASQHLDTLTIADGGKVVFAGAQVVVLQHLVMGGMDLGATALTPEPATLGLLALGGAALALGRRRRGRSW